ncbi:vesicular glutamate transporter 2 [Plakobranchus ocellatus]|uniref:Vesicular glutamate transporter 2 n=1 Tax=Plakobranchus ocellatus TaxID=259542 RepID=A0AAV4AZR1_9GAST|nr:vesicular glutamate transporter 2 [Plakobranchus ocellatus]
MAWVDYTFLTSLPQYLKDVLDFDISQIVLLLRFLAFIGVALCLTAVGYVNHENRYVAVGLLGLSGFFAGIQQAGYVANFIDIAPRFAGVMYGVGNSIATVSGILSPIIVGALTSGKSRTEWQIVFFACAGVSVIAAIVFVCFAQGHVQDWAIEELPRFHSDNLRDGNVFQKDSTKKREDGGPNK